MYARFLQALPIKSCTEYVLVMSEGVWMPLFVAIKFGMSEIDDPVIG
jgi:hypothetical protein